MPATTSSTARQCPACGEPGSGRFCAACGAQLGGAACAGCAAPLSPGARFCHRCGTPAGATPTAATRPGDSPATRDAASGVGTVLPWAVAFVAFLAVAAMAAGRNFGVRKGSGLDAPLNALPQAALGETGAPVQGGAPVAPFAGAAGAAGGRAPDLSQLTPRDIADRLFDRVMRLGGEGKVDSAQFFATMALQNYASMGDLDLDLRYDMGRVAEVAGQRAIVKAQADTILARNPTHLLGLVLAIKAAAMAEDETALAAAQRRLVAAEPTERPKNLEEYQRHRSDIDDALAQARRR
jgi:hypothetical protein